MNQDLPPEFNNCHAGTSLSCDASSRRDTFEPFVKYIACHHCSSVLWIVIHCMLVCRFDHSENVHETAKPVQMGVCDCGSVNTMIQMGVHARERTTSV